MKDFATEIIDKNFYCMPKEEYIQRQRREIMANVRRLRNAMKNPLKRSDLFPRKNYDKQYFEDMENLDK